MKGIFIALVVVALALACAVLFNKGRVVEIVQEKVVTHEVIVDPYERRVEELVASTTEEWKGKHRNWAEQEITKQILAEKEEELKKLRQEELSF